MKITVEKAKREEYVMDMQSTIEESARDFSASKRDFSISTRDLSISGRDLSISARDFSISNQKWNNDFSMSSNQQHQQPTTPLVSTQSLVAYKRRWLTLFIFSMNTMMNGLLFMSLSPVNNIAVLYYRVPSVNVEWLSNMFMLTYIFLALPSSYLMSKWGVRPIITIASCLNFIATALHFAGRPREKFWMVLLGQGFAAVAYCMIIQIPGKLSAQWFPERESATATSIGVFMNLLGVALGFLQPSIMVKDSHDMNTVRKGLAAFYMSQMALSAAILLLTMAYKERPATPPTLNSLRESNNFGDSLKILWRNKYYIILSQSYGIYFGLFITFSVLINPLITFKFPTGYETSLGWMGFCCDMAAIFSCLVIGVLLDKYHRHQLTATLLNLFSMIIWLAFILTLTQLKSFVALYILYVLLGLCGVPYFASGMEQAAEMTYPVSEETSSTIILIFGNLYGFIFIFTLGIAAQSGYIEVVGYTMVSLYFLSTVLAAFAKTELKRSNAEKRASVKSITISKSSSVRTIFE